MECETYSTLGAIEQSAPKVRICFSPVVVVICHNSYECGSPARWDGVWIADCGANSKPDAGLVFVVCGCGCVVSPSGDTPSYRRRRRCRRVTAVSRRAIQHTAFRALSGRLFAQPHKKPHLYCVRACLSSHRHRIAILGCRSCSNSTW